MLEYECEYDWLYVKYKFRMSDLYVREKNKHELMNYALDEGFQLTKMGGFRVVLFSTP